MFKALNGPKRIKSLLNNYKSLSIAAALLIFSFCASGQRSSLLTPYDSNRVFQAISGYGFGWNNVYIKGSVIIPNDTPRLALKDSGGIANKGGTVYVWTGRFWNLITGISSLDSIRNNFNNTKIVLWAGGIAKDSLAKGIIKYQIANFKVTNISPGVDSVSYIGSGGGGASKYTTNQYGIIIDSSTANLYKIKADSTVLLSKLNANSTYYKSRTVAPDSSYVTFNRPDGTKDTLRFTGATAGGGAVTSVAALTLGTSGTDLSSTVANSTTTPVITLNVPTASAANRGALSSADWSTFNSKQVVLSGTGYSKWSGTTPSYLTPTQVTADLNLFSNTLQGLTPLSGGGTSNFLRADGTWAAPSGTGGTITTLSVVSANGLSGTVANPTTTPAITLSTTITGILKGNGTAMSAATAGTDYGRVDSIRFVNNGLIHTSPVAFSLSGNTAVITETLANQSPYTLLGRGSGTGVPSFLAAIDSNWIPALHSQTYYDGRYAVIGGGGGTPAGSTSYIQYNNGGAFAASGGLKFAPNGQLSTTKVYSGFYLKDSMSAVAINDTIVGMEIHPAYFPSSFTGVIRQTFKIGNAFMNTDSLYNFSYGGGNAAKPTSGNSNFFGQNAGNGATTAYNSNFLGNGAGVSASGAYNSNFLGNGAGVSASGATNSNFFGNSAGGYATNATNSNFFGNSAGGYATNAYSSNFFGTTAGNGATSANNSNFFGNYAGTNAAGAYNSNFFGNSTGYATNATSSNFFGFSAGNSATNANYSNFFGNYAGYQATAANGSNFFGKSAGNQATNANNSNFFGQNAGNAATNANYSNFFGYEIGDSLTFKITGSNNILIGTNITLPTAATSNSMNLGGVLYGTGFYGTITGNPKSTAQTTGQIGINVTTPAVSAALDVTSTTTGFLKPRMTTTQKNAITSPAEGLTVYDLTLHQMSYYNGTAWINY